MLSKTLIKCILPLRQTVKAGHTGVFLSSAVDHHVFFFLHRTFLEDKKTQLEPIVAQVQEQLRTAATNMEEQIKPLAENVQAQVQPMVDNFKVQMEALIQRLVENARAIGN